MTDYPIYPARLNGNVYESKPRPFEYVCKCGIHYKLTLETEYIICPCGIETQVKWGVCDNHD
jgi:hypothetical protein